MILLNNALRLWGGGECQAAWNFMGVIASATDQEQPQAQSALHIISYYIIRYYTILYYTILNYTILYYTILYIIPVPYLLC